VKIFSGSSNNPLAGAIAGHLRLTLSPVEVFVFPDGERRVRMEERVVEETALLVQTTSTPVDAHYMELFFLADAAKRSGAEFVVAIVPYMGYQRQDHVFRDGEAVSLEVIANLIKSVGVSRIISCDFHSAKIPEIFGIAVSHLSALPLFAEEIRRRSWVDERTFLVSPDMGGIRRIKQLSALLGAMPYVTVEKNRDLATGEVSAVGFSGTLGKRAVMVDDMISSGKTMIKAAELLVQHGVEEIVVFATHAVFSVDAPSLLQESVIKEVIVTDTVSVPQEKLFPKLRVMSVAGLIAQEVGKLAISA
jgi:ribose-phosphate pyrophosphokinase